MNQTAQTRRTLMESVAHRPAPEAPAGGMEPLAVPVAEACRLSGLSRSELYRRMRTGQIDARKSGRTTLVLMASLRAHLASLPPVELCGAKRAD